uniref:sensor histidine kinase n=1 Tax=Hydrogenophaga sp. TaxID=1904254 RepID=UPI0035687B2C
VAQLLQMARLEPDARKPEQTLVPLDALVRQVVGTFSARAEERGIDLGVENAEATWVLGDPHALRALLDNLVDNALRYTPPGARVDLRLQAVGDAQVALEVSDSGPGIAQADRQRVLDRFVRLAHLSADANATGSGLGLSIVREIALRHHAELALLDTPGGGLTVRLLFARAPALVTVAT